MTKRSEDHLLLVLEMTKMTKRSEDHLDLVLEMTKMTKRSEDPKLTKTLLKLKMKESTLSTSRKVLEKL